MIVHYHGNISPAYVPETLIDALAKTDPAIHLRIVGFEPIGRESHRARLTQRASALGVGDRIQVLSPEPRYRLIERCRQADVGLSFNPACKENFNQEFRASASNKAFEYLASGLALLVTDQPEWRTWFVEPGYGLACDSSDPDSIAGALEWFLHNPAARTAMGESGRQRILADWNYERQFEPVLSMLEGRSD
jgi:glycosyltransferase involved in cell wall biosynthesis